MILSLLIYAFVASFTPGPNNLMALYYANQFGLQKTLRFCIGVFLGFLVILACANFFSTGLAIVFPKVEWIMKVFGALYMLYLAYKIMTSTSGKTQSFSAGNNSIKAGAMLQFINPKAVIYAITVIATFVTPNFHSAASQLFFVLLLAFIGFLGTLCWSIFGSIFKELIAKYQLPFNIIMALLLVYTAISIVIH